MRYLPVLGVYELEDVKKRTDEITDALIDCICQLACCALIGDGNDAVVEFEAQHKLICAIPDGDIELQKDLLKVSQDKGVSHLLEICHTYYAVESEAAVMCAGKPSVLYRSPINLKSNHRSTPHSAGIPH